MNLKTQEFWIRTGELLKKLGKTQLELCNHCDINHQTYRGWIVRGTYPDALQVVNIAKYLNTSVEYLVTGEKSEQDTRLQQLQAEIEKLSNFSKTL